MQQTTPVQQPDAVKDTKKLRREKIRKYRRETLKRLKQNEELFFDEAVTQAKDERTTIAKESRTNARRLAIDNAHNYRTKPTVGIWQYGCNLTNKIKSAFNQTLKSNNKANQVRFKPQHTVRLIKSNSVVMITYDSRADGHYYISKKNRKASGLPILSPSTK